MKSLRYMMDSKIRFPLLLLCFLVYPIITIAQQKEDQRFNLTVTNESLNEVLDRLSQMAGVNFTFNAADPTFAKKITYQAKEKHFDQLLAELLVLSGHNFRQIGNQLVVFPVEIADEPQQAVSQAPLVRYDTIFQIIEKPVVQTDTLVRYETMVQIDTLIIRDTVVKEVFRDSPKRDIKRLPKDIFRFEPNREDGLALGFFYGRQYSGTSHTADQINETLLNLNKETETPGFRHFSLGTELMYNKNKWTFSAGIQLTGFATRFQYDDIQQTGGYYRTDTISWYYNLVQTDTTWFPVTDSTYLPLEKSEFYYNQLNRLGYLDFQLGVAYNFYADDNISIYLKAAGGLSLLIYKDGVLLRNDNGFPGMPFEEATFSSSLISYMLGTGVKYKAFDWWDVYAELAYRSHLGSFLNDYAIEKRNYGIGLKVGLIYYF
jgi:hypothetical protein